MGGQVLKVRTTSPCIYTRIVTVTHHLTPDEGYDEKRRSLQ